MAGEQLKNTVRTRFAPSPTGFVHIGNFRTALFSHLWAKHNGGISILRIEDTDQTRKVEGAVEHLLRVMNSMGIEFDEGFRLTDGGAIEQRGEYGPYLQSERLPLYQQYANDLVAEGKAYFCYCSEERLDELRKEQTALKKPPMYDRLCYHHSAEEKQQRAEEFRQAGKNPVVRFLIPEGQTVVHDLIYGDITYDHKVLDDQVILKSDGFPTYHLAVVIDDHFMEVTHVIRGDEWIPSTPKHILLYQAFGWQPTEFAHAPLILNPDKTKLSKRQGDVAIEDYLKKGYLPQALINFVAFLGWNPKTEQEFFSMDELVKQFDLSKVNKSGAVFDIHKLDWISAHYIKELPVEQLAEKLKPFWEEWGIKVAKYSQKYLQAIAGLEQERLKKLSEIGERTGYFFQRPEYDGTSLVWKKSSLEQTKSVLTGLAELFSSLSEEVAADKTLLEAEIKKFISQHNLDNGTVLWPLRYCLTGLEKSPSPFEVAATLTVGLGKQEIVERLNIASGTLTTNTAPD